MNGRLRALNQPSGPSPVFCKRTVCKLCMTDACRYTAHKNNSGFSETTPHQQTFRCLSLISGQSSRLFISGAPLINISHSARFRKDEEWGCQFVEYFVNFRGEEADFNSSINALCTPGLQGHCPLVLCSIRFLVSLTNTVLNLDKDMFCL